MVRIEMQLPFPVASRTFKVPVADNTELKVLGRPEIPALIIPSAPRIPRSIIGAYAPLVEGKILRLLPALG